MPTHLESHLPPYWPFLAWGLSYYSNSDHIVLGMSVSSSESFTLNWMTLEGRALGWDFSGAQHCPAQPGHRISTG